MSSFNKQYSDPPFGMAPGIAHTGLAGTQGAADRAPDDVPATVTSPAGTWWNRTATTTSGTTMPGQFSGISALMGLDDEFVTSTGAGEGSPSHFPRRDFQQPDGA